MDFTGPNRPQKQFVLCFDGTGNKFAGDESDTNLLKIYRMLDRSKRHQYHYYQPGIGTYVTSHSFGNTSRLQRIQSSYQKAKDAAIGSSFDEHVLGGYKFLMRYYSPGDEIFFFGFSRGSYTARFLAEMLDYIGLLQPGNEELIRFAWKTFARWQQRKTSADEKDREEHKKLFAYMKAFRETFSRPVTRIRFLGLFDTVNSVPVFENAWMERSKFPYTAQTSARIIRHAVSIDERRAKFRQDLISEVTPWSSKHARYHFRKLIPHGWHRSTKPDLPKIVLDTPDQASTPSGSIYEKERYRARSPRKKSSIITNQLAVDGAFLKSRRTSGTSLHAPHLHTSNHNGEDNDQDISEVWFSGQHGDVGGGWKLDPENPWPLSHIPLVWMVREAQLAGLEFDPLKLKRFKCDQHDMNRDSNGGVAHTRGINELKEKHGTDSFYDALYGATRQGIVHDCLTYGGGLSHLSTLAWRLMEYLPFRRMDLQPDGSWKPIRWPLPCGEVRDIPNNAQIHVSAIQRMRIDPTYRPGNLIVGGGGRGTKKAPEKYGIGEWIVSKHEGDQVRETYVRKQTLGICHDVAHSKD